MQSVLNVQMRFQLFYRLQLIFSVVVGGLLNVCNIRDLTLLVGITLCDTAKPKHMFFASFGNTFCFI